ncbi:hypothetical protein BCR25_11905 [Enterococcus termitis]|uniref:Uncharacterized protein n=1 Tax=Enterococcus termitis TaxID=332950 RepID=A0A1E5G990_9ENTE|nr:hypothetical protein BCR25_11905 [Enterococcus termitis]
MTENKRQKTLETYSGGFKHKYRKHFILYIYYKGRITIEAIKTMYKLLNKKGFLFYCVIRLLSG